MRQLMPVALFFSRNFRLGHLVHASMADLPVGKMLGGHHVFADLTPPFGRTFHVYLRV